MQVCEAEVRTPEENGTIRTAYDDAVAVRSESSKRAVLQATMELLDGGSPEGLSVKKLSIEAIAERAGVGKMTIYRWWRSKVAVIIDSFLENHVAQTPIDTEGPAIDALRRHVASLARVYAGPEGRLVAQLIAECQYDPDALDEFRERFWKDRGRAVRALIERAVDEGSLRREVDPEFIGELIYAPIYFRLLSRSGPLDDAFAETVVATVLAGVAPYAVDSRASKAS